MDGLGFTCLVGSARRRVKTRQATMTAPFKNALLFSSTIGAPKAVVRTITPEEARKILETKNTHNRPVTDGAVQRYASQMKAGKWVVNGEAIIFAADGSLMDGQHRLWACIEANVPFTTLVVEGVPFEAFVTINTGRKRTAGDVLGMGKVKNANHVANAARWVMAITQDRSYSNLDVSHAEIVEFCQKNPDVESAVQYVHACRSIISLGIAGALHFLFSLKDEDEANRYFVDLATGAGLAADDGVFVLRERLIRQRLEKLKLAKDDIVALSIRAWNHRREGAATKTLKGRVRNRDGTLSIPAIV